MARRAKLALAPGLNVRNESDVPIVFVMSQLSPLHWTKVGAGETKHIDCGRVFFTISTTVHSQAAEPTAEGVAARIGAIAVVTVFTGGILGIGVVGGISGATSSVGVKMDGVCADGRTIVIGGQTSAAGHTEIYFKGIEAQVVETY